MSELSDKAPQTPFTFSGTLPPMQLAQLQAFVTYLECDDNARLVVNPEQIPRTEDGFRKDMLTKIPEGWYISRTNLSQFAVKAARISHDGFENKTLITRQRSHAYSAFDTMATHILSGHSQHGNCDCPLNGIYRLPTGVYRPNPRASVFIEPTSFIQALEGDPSQQPPLAATLGKLATGERAGNFAEPGKSSFRGASAWSLVEQFAAALRAS